jgi:hypothetical protein
VKVLIVGVVRILKEKNVHFMGTSHADQQH